VETNASGELGQKIIRPPVFWAVDHFSRPLPIGGCGQMLMFAGRPFPIAVEVLVETAGGNVGGNMGGKVVKLVGKRRVGGNAGGNAC